MLYLNALLAAFDNLDPMNWEVLKHSLNFLWQGLLAIFVVIALIIISVKITAVCIQKAEDAKKRREEEKTDTPNNNA